MDMGIIYKVSGPRKNNRTQRTRTLQGDPSEDLHKASPVPLPL